LVEIRKGSAVQRYVGNARDDGAATRSWFVGHFIDPSTGDVRSTSAFESKWCVCGAGDRRTTPSCTTGGTTLVILVSGLLRLVFDDNDVVLSEPADYTMWNGEAAHSWIAEADSVVITFRTPSAGQSQERVAAQRANRRPSTSPLVPRRARAAVEQ
jgi:hypothetical protein